MKYLNTASNFVKHPSTKVKGYDNEAFQSYEQIGKELAKAKTGKKTVIVVDCYVAVDQHEIIEGLTPYLQPDTILRSDDIFYDEDKVYELLKHNITDDRVYGIAYHGQWRDLVDEERLKKAQEEVKNAQGTVLIIGTAASYIDRGDVLVLADMTIWETQMRYRNEHCCNFKANNPNEDMIRKFKRG